MLQVGDRAPDFTARTTEGKTLSLADLRGKVVVLYFFPKAFTPGCIRETARFRDAQADIEALGGSVVGVSVDDHKTMCDFAESMHVGFPMIADDEHRLSTLYGVLRPFLKLDKRVTYVIDPNGVIQGVFAHEFQISRHLDNVLMLLEKLVA